MEKRSRYCALIVVFMFSVVCSRYAVAGGAISGRVTKNADGTGVANVLIRVHDAGWQYVNKAVTDSSGCYSVSGLPEGAYHVQTSNEENYVDEYYDNVTAKSGATSVRVTEGSDASNIDFALTRWGSISGRVVDGLDDKGIGNIQVRIYNKRWSVLYSRQTDSTGHDSVGHLPAGKYYLLTANDQHYVDEAYEDVAFQGSCWPPEGATPIEVTLGSDTGNINIRLSQGASISGKVIRDSDGAPIENATVGIFSREWNLLREVLTDSAGRYTILRLLTGSYHVKAFSLQGDYVDQYHRGATTERSAAPVNVKQGNKAQDIDFSLYIGGSISGCVTRESDGKGIQDVEIRVYDSTWTFLQNGYTDWSGCYRVGKLPDGAYYVRTQNGWNFIDEIYNDAAGENAANAVNVKLGADTPRIRFALVPGGSISGRVTREKDDEGIQRVYVNVYDSGWRFVNGEEVDIAGRYTVRKLPAGSYYVRTTNGEGYFDQVYGSSNTENAPTPVSVEQGSSVSNIDIVLKAKAPEPGRR